MKKFASLFSCAGCVDQLPKRNGFDLVYANEIDSEVAELYRRNHGDHIEVCDVVNATPPSVQLDWLHASPSCKLDSKARLKMVTVSDRAAQISATMQAHRFAKATAAKFVSMENVTSYYHTEAFLSLKAAMIELGYELYQHTSTVLGIGQKRRRSFAFFTKDLSDVPTLPTTDQADYGWGHFIDINMLEPVEYLHLKKQPAVIENLLKTATEPFIIERGKMSGEPRTRFASKPLWTIVSSLVADGNNSGNGRTKYLLVIRPDGQGFNMHHDQLKKLQGFAPDFDLGKNPRLAVGAIGNACSPQHLSQAISDTFCQLKTIGT